MHRRINTATQPTLTASSSNPRPPLFLPDPVLSSLPRRGDGVRGPDDGGARGDGDKCCRVDAVPVRADPPVPLPRRSFVAPKSNARPDP
jgi:hypothetical protein